jgi:outer membrane biosynthesis protein TonB
VTPFSQHVGSKQNEPPLNTGGSSGSLGAGVLLSVGLHAVLIGFVIFGLPIFWQPEVLPGAIGIELAQLSDITAAPKVQKEGKPNKQPEPQPEVKKEEPKKETPPPPPAPPKPAAAPPPPAAEPEPEVAEAIPDPEAEKRKEEEKKKEEQKKKEEEKKKKEAEKKKKEDEIKKQQKKDDAALDKLLTDLAPDKPAPEPDKKPEKKKADAKPAEPSTGPQTADVSEVPMTASEEDGIRGQIERNWNLGSLAGAPDLTGMLIEVRITLQPDGTVTGAKVINQGSSPMFRQASEGAVRAVMISSPLKLPPGKTYNTMVLRFRPDQVMQ